MASTEKKIGALKYSDKNEEYTPQVSGIAHIKTGETKAKITFDDASKLFDNGTNVKTIALADLPRYPKIEPTSEGVYKVRLTKDADEIDSIYPAEGHFYAKIADFGGRKGKEDADPAPYEKVYHKGQSDEERHLEFVVTYKITRGKMKNATLPLFLHYKFEEDGEGFAKWKGNPEYAQATRLLQLVDWCQKHKLIDEPIPWPEDGNILPELLQRALDSDVEVEIVVKNGNILKDGLLAVGESDDDEKLAPKKSAASTKKVVKKSSDDEEDDL